MVLPLLPVLGLLAGTAALGQAGISGTRRYFENKDRERYKREIGGLLSDLPEGAGPDETARKLAMGGMLSPEQMMQYGFGDASSARDFGEDWQLELLRQSGALDQNQQAATADYMKGRQQIVSTFQPQLDGLNRQYDNLNNIIAIAKEAKEMSPFDYNKWVGSPEGRAVMAQLQELETAGFYDFKRQVYGDAEPPAHVLEDLQNRYRQFTQGGIMELATDGRWDLISEIYDRRLQDVQRRAKNLAIDYDRNMQAYDLNALQPTPNFPGLGDIDVSPHGRDGGVSMSGRNMPPLIQMESGGDWGATNDEGMSGRLQFSPERLNDYRRATGSSFSREDFLRSPDLQKRVESWHWGDIEDFVLDEGLDEFIGQRIAGIPVTFQGLLNVAHLGGKHGMMRFLKSGGRYNPKDSNGKHLSDYLALGVQSYG